MRSTVNGFKSKLEKERSRRMGLFLDWSLQGIEAVSSLEGAAGPVSYLRVTYGAREGTCRKIFLISCARDSISLPLTGYRLLRSALIG